MSATEEGSIVPNAFWRGNDLKGQAALPPGSLNPFSLPPGATAALLCYSTSPTRQTLVEQLAGQRALTNFTLALNRVGSKVSKTQGKTEHTLLVRTNRIFPYHGAPRLICFQCGVQWSLSGSLQLGTTEKENQTRLKQT